MDTTTAELAPIAAVTSARETALGGSLSLAYPEKIPPASDVRWKKTNFLNRDQGFDQTVPFHLRQGTWELELPFIKNDKGEMHIPRDRNGPEMKNAWVLKQVKDRNGVNRLVVFKGREQFGKAEGYTREDLANGALVLPWDDTSLTMESLGVTRFDPEATLVEVYRYKHLSEPVPPTPVPVRDEDRPVPVEDKKWTEAMRQRLKQLQELLPDKLVDVIPAFLLSQMIAHPSVESGPPPGAPLVPPQDQGIVEPHKAPPMPEFKPPPAPKPLEAASVPEAVLTPEVVPTPAFDHPAIEPGASFKGLSEHWLGLIADRLEKRGTGQTSSYDKEMDYRKTVLKGIKHFETEAERQQLDEALEWLEQKYLGIKDAYFDAFKASALNHNRKVLVDPEDPEQDRLITTIFSTDDPLEIFEKAVQKLGKTQPAPVPAGQNAI